MLVAVSAFFIFGVLGFDGFDAGWTGYKLVIPFALGMHGIYCMTFIDLSPQACALVLWCNKCHTSHNSHHRKVWAIHSCGKTFLFECTLCGWSHKHQEGKGNLSYTLCGMLLSMSINAIILYKPYHERLNHILSLHSCTYHQTLNVKGDTLHNYYVHI